MILRNTIPEKESISWARFCSACNESSSQGGKRNVVDTTKYKSIAIKIPYYDALVRMGLTKHRGPGQEMMHMISKEATVKGIRIRDKGIIKSKRASK